MLRSAVIQLCAVMVTVDDYMQYLTVETQQLGISNIFRTVIYLYAYHDACAHVSHLRRGCAANPR